MKFNKAGLDILRTNHEVRNNVWKAYCEGPAGAALLLVCLTACADKNGCGIRPTDEKLAEFMQSHERTLTELLNSILFERAATQSK